MEGEEFFDHVQALADRASVIIEYARQISVIQFGEDVGAESSTILKIASIMVSLDAKESLSNEISNGLSSIENSINGK